MGTAICQRLAKDGFKVIAGCAQIRHAKIVGLLSKRRLAMYDFIASDGNVFDCTVAAFDKVKAEVGLLTCWLTTLELLVIA